MRVYLAPVGGNPAQQWKYRREVGNSRNSVLTGILLLLLPSHSFGKSPRRLKLVVKVFSVVKSEQAGVLYLEEVEVLPPRAVNSSPALSEPSGL